MELPERRTILIDLAKRGALMPNWDDCDAVERHPDRVSTCAWVFRGTRVPVSALFVPQGWRIVEEFL